MNENFKKILENNKMFIDIIDNIVKEIKKQSKIPEPDFILKQDLLNKLREYSLVNFFSEVSLNLGNIGVSGIKFNYIILRDIEGNKWKFLSTKKELKLKSVERLYALEGFSLLHDESKSVIVKENRDLSITQKKENQSFEYTNKKIDQEFIDLIKIEHDIDLSFCLNIDIDDFKVSDKKKKQMTTLFNAKKNEIKVRFC